MTILNGDSKSSASTSIGTSPSNTPPPSQVRLPQIWLVYRLIVIMRPVGLVICIPHIALRDSGN